ncbi:DUF86 domain-containing protein [Cohnella yongneupensis]|uniref:DUF86 domain-containing protein n=1 Tax=Cohnella yongneupensis TaxID=425006 RepID=A0ABW0QY13_9BACL
MYNVNETLIQERLACIPEIADVLNETIRSWSGKLTEGFVQERALHLGAEIVTDIGHALIDGFIMRDASSYEDIVDIIAEENVIEQRIAARLRELVLLRKALVQDFVQWPRRELHPLTPELPALLRDFAEQVEAYLEKELRG